MRISGLPAVVCLTVLTTACNFTPVRQTDRSPQQAEPRSPAHSSTLIQPRTVTGTTRQDTEGDQIAALTPASEEHQPDDLWQLIRSQLTLQRNLDNKKVQAKLAWFARNQDYLDRVSDRAQPYLYHIVTEIKRRGLPMELALLPIVESAYQPFANSPSHASGLWQFIPATGKRFGLKQNWWYDGRRDIVAATDAALRYLQELNERFNGDWELALAAYNAGEYNIERAIKRNIGKGRGTDFWSLDLYRETENYVPSFHAIAEIIANPQKYNLRIRPVSNEPYFTVVDVDGQIDLARVAELSGLDMDAVYTLNPGFNRWATDPGGPHRLLLPVSTANAFRAGLESMPAAERISWKQYTIRSGDTLGGIAARHNTSVAALKDTNRLRSNRIRAGKSLLIPVSSKPSGHYTMSLDARRFRDLKPAGDGRKYVYTVRRGDTLWDIGRHYGISVDQLCRWNGISSRTLLALGQQLEIWVETDQDQGKVIPVAARSVSKAEGMVRYEVRQGDSLWLIARKFGVSVAELRKWNKLPRNRHLQPGQHIDIHTATTGA